MDRKGFISISVVYTLFIVLLMLLLSILAGYVNKRILLKVNKSDVTDVLVESEDNRNIATVCRGKYLATCFTENSRLDKTLYKHDGEKDILDQPNINLETNEISYRYSGANDKVFNYVCLKDNCNDNELYRIIGFFDVGTFDKDNNGVYLTKLIKYTSIGKRQWNNTNNNEWWNSSLKNFLNDTSTSPLKNYLDKITAVSWYASPQRSTNMIKNNALTVFQYESFIKVDVEYKMMPTYKLGLMYISDYMYAANPTYWSYVGDVGAGGGNDYAKAKNDNWLAGLTEYVIDSNRDNGSQAFKIISNGKVGAGTVTETADVRPVFYLDARYKVKTGIGTKTDPYRLVL